MKLDDPNFCVGTFLSQQLADGCDLDRQQALLASLQRTLSETQRECEVLTIAYAPVLQKGQPFFLCFVVILHLLLLCTSPVLCFRSNLIYLRATKGCASATVR